MDEFSRYKVSIVDFQTDLVSTQKRHKDCWMLMNPFFILVVQSNTPHKKHW